MLSLPLQGGTATVASTSSPNVASEEVTVNLANVSDRQTIIVNVIGATVNGAPETFSVPVGILFGDVNASRVVIGSDLNLIKAQVSRPLNGENFRTDVNVTGVITGSDLNLLKQKQSSTLD